MIGTIEDPSSFRTIECHKTEALPAAMTAQTAAIAAAIIHRMTSSELIRNLSV